MRWKLPCLVMLCAGAAVQAQDEKRDPARLLAPYVNEATFAAVEIDVKNLDFDVIFHHLAQPKLATTRAAELARDRDAAKQMRDAFLRAGGRFAYLVLNLPQIPVGLPQPLVMIPADKAETREALTALLKPLPEIRVEARDGVLLAGRPAVLQALARQQPRAVPQLAQAWDAVAPLPQRVALLPPDVLRRTLEELVPELPKPLGGGSIKTVTRGLRWVAVGLDLSEKYQVRVIIQANSAEDAQKLEGLGRRAIELAVKEARLPAELAQILRPNVVGDRLELTLEGKTIDTTLLTMLGRVRESASRAQSTNNLKQIALAMHNYHDVHKSFAPQASYDKQKKPLLSWRVHLLPFVDAGELYKQFHLDEPWDSEHNKALIRKMPKVYHSPLMSDLVAPGKTTYLLPVGPKLLWNGPKAPTIRTITDGTSNTIMALDVDESRAVFWTQPEDLAVDPKHPTAGVIHKDIGILASLCDGSVRVLPATIAPQEFWALLTPAGGEVIDWDKTFGR